MKKIRPLAVSVLLIVSAIVFVAFVIEGNSKDNKTGTATENPKAVGNYSIFAVDIPKELSFAGEKVPIDQTDVIESLDREVLVNTYWQSQTLLFIKRANRYFPAMEKILKKYKVPDDFKYLAVAESGLTHAVSPARAVGFWQLMEGTAEDYGLEVNAEIDERYNIEKSTEVACKYLLESYEKYGNWTMAAASYNAGRRGIDRQIDRQKDDDYYDLLLYEETSRYMFRILAFKMILSDPEKFGFHVGEEDLYNSIPSYEVTVDGPVSDFSEFAKKYDITYKTLKLMNPWLRDTKLTNHRGNSYFVKIPRKGYFDTARVDK